MDKQGRNKLMAKSIPRRLLTYQKEDQLEKPQFVLTYTMVLKYKKEDYTRTDVIAYFTIGNQKEDCW